LPAHLREARKAPLPPRERGRREREKGQAGVNHKLLLRRYCSAHSTITWEGDVSRPTGVVSKLLTIFQGRRGRDDRFGLYLEQWEGEDIFAYVSLEESFHPCEVRCKQKARIDYQREEEWTCRFKGSREESRLERG